MDALTTYKRELLRWNERINLIGPEAKANLDGHVDEAIKAAEILKPHGNVLDFGSGGGLPAIPMRPEEVGVSEARGAGVRVERCGGR